MTFDGIKSETCNSMSWDILFKTWPHLEMSLSIYCFTVDIFVIHLNVGISLWNIPVTKHMIMSYILLKGASHGFKKNPKKTKAKTSMHICAVWSEPLFAHHIRTLRNLLVQKKDSSYTTWLHSLVWFFLACMYKYRKMYCTTHGIGIVSISKTFKFYIKILCDGQDAVRQAILYVNRSCLFSGKSDHLFAWGGLYKTGRARFEL